MNVRLLLIAPVGLMVLAACGGSTPTPATPPPPVAASAASAPPSSAPPSNPPAATDSTPAASTALSPPLDEKAVAEATGVDKVEKSPDGTIKASWPRKDDVVIAGWKIPPFMGLTSWAAFEPGRSGVVEAMVMGDLVLLEDEVNPVMSKLLDGGAQVTALHNHFFFDSPKVYFMHIGGEGKVEGLGKAVKSAMDEVAAIRKKTPTPTPPPGWGKVPAKSSLDAAKLDAALGTKGQSKDGMYKAVWGRDVLASCGCQAGKAMGVNTWAGMAGTEDNAVVDGDFAVSEAELQPVLKSLRGSGINVVAIHHHMTGEQPRILFLHYWGRGKALELAASVKKAVELTAWSGAGKTTI